MCITLYVVLNAIRSVIRGVTGNSILGSNWNAQIVMPSSNLSQLTLFPGRYIYVL